MYRLRVKFSILNIHGNIFLDILNYIEVYWETACARDSSAIQKRMHLLKCYYIKITFRKNNFKSKNVELN